MVLYDAAKNTQKFINGGTPVTGGEVVNKDGEILEGITAMATSPNKRWVAVAEKGTTQVLIYLQLSISEAVLLGNRVYL